MNPGLKQFFHGDISHFLSPFVGGFSSAAVNPVSNFP
jgi:hypothetical protein